MGAGQGAVERRRAKLGMECERECEFVVGGGGRAVRWAAEAAALEREGVQQWRGLTSFFASFCCTSASFAISQCLLGKPPSDGADALVEVLVEGVLPSFFEALRERERGAGGGRWLSDMLGKLDMVERVSFGRDSHEMLPLSPRIMPRAALPRWPLYEENEEESVLERGGRMLCLMSLPSGMVGGSERVFAAPSRSCASQLGAPVGMGSPSTGAR